MLNYKRTKYPTIFKKCYWGYFSEKGSPLDIYNNRNNFKEEYDIIKGRGKEAPKYIKKDLLSNFSDKGYIFIQDHFEIYETEKAYIGVFSNYGKKTKDIEKAKNFGYNIYKDLYNCNTTTMIKEVFKKKYRTKY